MKRLLSPSFGRAWLLAVLLLAAQAAGLAHRVAHAPGQGGPNAFAQSARAASATSATSAASATSATSGTGDAWSASHSSGSADCRLVDQLAHADALCGAAIAPLLLTLSADDALAPAPASLPARPAQAYRARAPPHA